MVMDAKGWGFAYGLLGEGIVGLVQMGLGRFRDDVIHCCDAQTRGNVC